MLKIHTTNLGAVAILCLQGRVVNGETAALSKAVDSLSGASAVILDLARVSSIDAGGLGVLLELRARTESKGIPFKLMNVTKLVRRVLEITRLDSVFEICRMQTWPTPQVLNQVIWFSVRGKTPMPALARLPIFDAMRLGLTGEREELARNTKDNDPD